MVVLFLTVEVSFFAANIAKVEHGAWLPLLVALVISIVMINWRRGQVVVTRNRIMREVWNVDWLGSTKTLDVHVKRLRAKGEPDPGSPRHIVTVRGLGYKFEP